MARRLADLLVELGRPRQAAEVWEAFLYVAPLDAELHQRLGEFYLESRPGAEAIREFSVVLALKPVDQAQAHFNLARAYAAAGRRPEARREVLAALEIAPGFSSAQKLLLELSQ
jgi:tetratricopeptide (TPR) repeat protein